MTRWLPFYFLLAMVAASLLFFFLSAGSSEYVPAGNDPSVIYKEACAGCHGANGLGTRFYYPNLVEERIKDKKVIRTIREGEFMMPSFPGIVDSTLTKLARYVAQRRYLKTAQKP